MGHDTAHDILSSVLKNIQEKDVASVAACDTINTWVEKETKSMIKKLFNPADLDPNTMVALCSALHFKGKWKFPFGKPFEDVFKLNDKDTQKATFMTVKFEEDKNEF